MADWSVAGFPQRCDNHAGVMAPGTPYLVERWPGRYRRICARCVTGQVPVRAQPPSLRSIRVSWGATPCPHCSTCPPKGEPWTTIALNTTVAIACLDCWSRWAQGIPLGGRR